MKTTFMNIALVAGLIIVATACNQGPGGKKAETSEAAEAAQKAGDQYTIDMTASTVNWTGSKPTGNHFGTIEFSEGYVTVEDGQINGGKFVFDMNTIVSDDIADPEMNARLVGHLKSADFFHVDSFPTAEFVITNIEEKEGLEGVEGEPQPTHIISGNLTIKGVTKGISFPGRVYAEEGMYIGESNTFTIDRTEWGVNYGSRKIFDNLMDQFIYDEIGLKVRIVAR